MREKWFVIIILGVYYESVRFDSRRQIYGRNNFIYGLSEIRTLFVSLTQVGV